MQQIISNSPTYGCNQSTIFYNMVGNFIPPEWQRLSDPSGKVLSKTSRQLLSLIVACFESGTDCTADELQESYYFFEQQLGVCQRRVRQCLLELEQAGFMTLKLLTVIKHHIKCRNILSIKLLKNFKNTKQINNDNNNYQRKNFPSNTKDFSTEPERNFNQERNKIQPHNIIDNNISILKSRSNESSFINFSEDNFSKSENQKTTKQNRDKNDDENQDPPQGNSSNWLNVVATKAKDFCRLKKKLVEFHPLSEADAWSLQMQSGREFNLSFINKLLLKLAAQYPNHAFHNKKILLSYMSKALTYELRDACKVNNEGFRFKQDPDVKAKEDYLQELEYSRDTSQTTQFRRKIAAIFEPELAYALLTSCSFNDPQDNCYKLRLIKDITIPQPVQDCLWTEARAVYGDNLKHLEIIPFTADNNHFTSKAKTTTETVDNYAYLQGLDSNSVWFKIRKCLIDALGVATDKNWFSKLEVVDEDQVNKKIILKPATPFIRDWINQNYQSSLEKAFGLQEFSFEMVKC